MKGLDKIDKVVPEYSITANIKQYKKHSSLIQNSFNK